jgi:hypothetical protein
MGELDVINYAEYTYGRKSEGKVLALKLLAVAGYFLFIIAYFIVCITLVPIHLFAVAPIFTWILVFFTWRYVSYDYYFEFKSGSIELGTVRGGAKGRKRKLKKTVTVKEATQIVRYSGDISTLGKLDRLFDFSGSKASENRVALVYEKEEERFAVIFECTSKCANLLASFNSRAAALRGAKFHG